MTHVNSVLSSMATDLSIFADKCQVIKRFFLNNLYMNDLYDIFILNNIQKHITSDDAEIIGFIGLYYHLNTNYIEAIAYYLIAIEKHNSNAMYCLGYYYFKTEKNYEKAIQYYLMAIEQNNDVAMTHLGVYYYNIEKNYEKAIRYYLMAIEKNNDEAMIRLGIHYKNIEKDYDRAVYYYLMAHKQNNYDATYLLGIYYYSMEKNINVAKQYLKMASENSIYDATRSLSICYHAEKDYENSLYYLELYLENANYKDDRFLGYINRDVGMLILMYLNKNDIILMFKRIQRFKKLFKFEFDNYTIHYVCLNFQKIIDNSLKIINTLKIDNKNLRININNLESSTCPGIGFINALNDFKNRLNSI